MLGFLQAFLVKVFQTKDGVLLKKKEVLKGHILLGFYD
jgi:hypothetical protein